MSKRKRIVLGAIAIKSKMALSPSAFAHLESAHNLFQKVSDDPRAAKILVCFFVVVGYDVIHHSRVAGVAQVTRKSAYCFAQPFATI